MELNYKASNIARAERLHNANFFKTLENLGQSSPSLSDILFVLEAGGVSEDEAGDIVDSKGLVDAIKLAVERLTDAGFLAHSPELTKAKEALQQEASLSTGETTKA